MFQASEVTWGDDSMTIRFIHTSDWQLGITRHFLDEDAQARFAEARRDAIRRMGDLAEDSDAQFLIVCGDVFESNHLDRRTVVRALEAMREVGVPIYILPGNHDPLNAGSIYTSATFKDHCPENVHVITTSEPHDTPGGAELVGAPWQTKRPLTDLVGEAIEGLEESDNIRILLGHGQVDSLSPDPDDPALIDANNLEATLRDGFVDYVALGDRHSTTAVGDSGRIWYSGAPEPTGFDEADPGNVLLVTLEEDDIDVQKRPVADWEFGLEEFHLSHDEDLDQIEAWLDDHDSKERTILKLSLKGTLNLQQKARLDDLIQDKEETFASLETWDRHEDLAVRPDEIAAEDLGLSGFAETAFERLQKKAKGAGEEAEAAEEALGRLYRLSQGEST